jgi:hypothetical protein
LAKNALERRAGDWKVNDTYAAVQMLLGHCRDAIAYETKAADLAKNAREAAQQRVAVRLSTYRSACAKPQEARENVRP